MSKLPFIAASIVATFAAQTLRAETGAPEARPPVAVPLEKPRAPAQKGPKMIEIPAVKQDAAKSEEAPIVLNDAMIEQMTGRKKELRATPLEEKFKQLDAKLKTFGIEKKAQADAFAELSKMAASFEAMGFIINKNGGHETDTWVASTKYRQIFANGAEISEQMDFVFNAAKLPNKPIGAGHMNVTRRSRLGSITEVFQFGSLAQLNADSDGLKVIQARIKTLTDAGYRKVDLNQVAPAVQEKPSL